MTFPTTFAGSVGMPAAVPPNGQLRTVSALDAEAFSHMLTSAAPSGTGLFSVAATSLTSGMQPTLGDAILNGLRKFDGDLQHRWASISSALDPVDATQALSATQLLQTQMQLAMLVYETQLGHAVANQAEKNIDQIVHMQ